MSQQLTTDPVGTGVASPGASSNSAAAQRWQASLMSNYPTPQLELVSGDGAVVTDAEGRQYLDLLGGIAVNALGHAHPAVVQAVSRQVGTLGHTSNLFIHPVVLELAERLLDLSGAAEHNGRVLFTNSGAEANEAAFKIARLTGRRRIISTHNGFHGRTMGALALTGQPGKQQPFAPMVPGVEFVDYGDADALRAAVAAEPDQVAAFVVEPIQGEAGVNTPPADYLARVRRITADVGALLIVDEIQTGIGRTGHWFAFQQHGIVPDVVTLAKGLGGGLPIGAVIGFGDAAALLTPGMHGSTFAGNPVSAAAALAVLSTITEQRLLDHVQSVGKHLANGVTELNHPLVAGVRGSGLLLGIALTEPLAPAVVSAAQAAGFLVNAPAPDVLRLAPPLILTTAQADTFLAALPALLTAAQPSTDTENGPA